MITVTKLKHSLLSFLFPPLCLSCEELVDSSNLLLCNHCASQLELIEPVSRCPKCFSSERYKCSYCARTRHPFSGIAASFEYVGPAATLIKKMKYGGLSYLAKTFAACLVTQMERLDWPTPDVIVPVPISFDRKLQRGFNQSVLIAEALSLLINVPTKDVLIRSMGEYSQSGLTNHQRKNLKKNHFYLRKNPQIQDKIILLIDDVATTGKTLEICGEALLEGYPSKLYGLTVCKN